MKKLLYLLFFLPVFIMAQARYGVEGVPMCWTTAGGIDSSITRYVLISTTGKPVKTIVYENAYGVVVNMSGGTVKYGFCDCSGGMDSLANNSVTFNKVSNSVKDSFTVYYASTAQIAAMPRAFVGQRLKLRGSGAEYLVSNDSIAGFRNDGKAVVKITALNRYAQVQPGELGYNVRDFGAIPDDGLSDDGAIQNCVNFAILNQIGVKNSVVVIPPGNFKLDKGIVIAKKNPAGLGALDFVAVDLIGTGVTPYSGEQSLGRQSVLEVRNKNGFGLGFLRGRNCSVKGIAFEGYAPMASNPGLDNVLDWTEAQWTSNGLFRNKAFSPYAGIAVDFASTTFDSDSYPDWAEYYGVNLSGGGTSFMNIDRCSFNGFMVGIAYSISKHVQNGDNLRISNISAQYNKSVIAIGQDQTRGGSVNNGYFLFQEVVLDCGRYGRQFGTAPAMRDLNIAGGTKIGFIISSGNRAHFVGDNIYAESIWQVYAGAAAPLSFTNCAFDLQFVRRQPTYHIVGSGNFTNTTFKFYGGEINHSLWVDGFPQFTQSIVGARGVYRRGSNAGGEDTDRMILDQVRFINREANTNFISQKNIGNQLLSNTFNFAPSLGYPIDGNRISGSAGTIEVFGQPYHNIQEFSSILIKVIPLQEKAYLLSSTMRGRVARGDVIGSYTIFPVTKIPGYESTIACPLGTVSRLSGDSIFFEWTSVPYNVRDTTIGLLTVMSAPSSDLPFIASGTAGNSYLLTKTWAGAYGESRPFGPGLWLGTYITRQSATGDTIFLSKALLSNVTNGYYYFFKSRKTGVNRTNQDLVYDKNDRVIENGIEYIVTVPGKVGSSVPPTFVPAISTGIPALTAARIPFTDGVTLRTSANFAVDTVDGQILGKYGYGTIGKPAHSFVGAKNTGIGGDADGVNIYTAGTRAIDFRSTDSYIYTNLNFYGNKDLGSYNYYPTNSYARYYKGLPGTSALPTFTFQDGSNNLYNAGLYATGTNTTGGIGVVTGSTGSNPSMYINSPNAPNEILTLASSTYANTIGLGIGNNTSASSNQPFLRLGAMKLSAHPNGSMFIVGPSTYRMYFESIYGFNVYGGPGNNDNGNIMSILHTAAYTAGGIAPTSGIVNALVILPDVGGGYEDFMPASGTATLNGISINTKINTTGTYNGIARGIYYNPTITSGTGLTHRAWESTAGDMVVNAGKLIVGGTTPNATLHVVGDCVITSSLWLNSAKTVGILSGTGSPNGAIIASVGSTFIRTDGGAGTSFYVKETGTGNTGWIAK